MAYTGYKGITNAQRKANEKYEKEKVDAVHLRLPKGRKEHYQNAASAAGLSLNAFFVTSADEKIDRDHLAE